MWNLNFLIYFYYKQESSLLEVDDMSASESNIEAAALIASEPDPESRMNPYRRRKNK